MNLLLLFILFLSVIQFTSCEYRRNSFNSNYFPFYLFCTFFCFPSDFLPPIQRPDNIIMSWLAGWLLATTHHNHPGTETTERPKRSNSAVTRELVSNDTRTSLLLSSAPRPRFPGTFLARISTHTTATTFKQCTSCYTSPLLFTVVVSTLVTGQFHFHKSLKDPISSGRT